MYTEEMDLRQAIDVVFTRLQELQPDCVNRVLGAILVHLTENQIIDLARASDTVIRNYLDSIINQYTLLAANPMDLSSSSSPMSLPANPTPMLDMQLQNERDLRSFEVEFESFYSGGGRSSANNLNLNNLSGSRMSGQEVSNPREKTCRFFKKGQCGQGNDSRYSHGVNIEDSFSRMCVTDPIDISGSRMSGQEVSSRRRAKTCHYFKKGHCGHGNICRYSHEVLAEDAPKLDPWQLYMTFPADSTFLEHDVTSYFGSYGVVEDVRIPSLEKRMFGFVSFTNADTVKKILAEGNPHYICGSRVLVKPYRKKLKPSSDRSSGEKLESVMHGIMELNAVTEPDSDPKSDTRILRRHFLEEYEKEQALLDSRRNYTGLELARQLPSIHPFPNTDLAQSTTTNTDDFRYIEEFLSTDEPTTTTNPDSNNLP